MFTSRREREEIAALRAEIASLNGRLAADLNSLNAAGDPVSQQALADAGERSNAAGSLLSTATSAGELRVARRVVIEGMHATRLVRERQGLPLGADLPPLDAVSERTSVQVEDEQHTAHPSYHPDQPHYFDGGRFGSVSAPAGFYRTPFWKKALAVGGAVLGAEMLGDVLGDLTDVDRSQFGGGGDYDGWNGDGDGGGDWN